MALWRRSLSGGASLIAKHEGQAIVTGTHKRKLTFFYRLWEP